MLPKEALGEKSTLRLENRSRLFQSTVEPLFQDLGDNLKPWIDDFNLYSNTEDELLDVVDKSFPICKKYSLFLSAKKCIFLPNKLSGAQHH